MTDVADVIKAYANAANRGGETVVNAIFDINLTSTKLVDAAAGTTLNANIYRNTTGYALQVIAAEFIPDAAMTGATATAATISVLQGTVGAFLNAATLAFITGVDLVADVAKALVPSTTQANVTVANGSIIQFDIAKTGAGTAVPAGTLQVKLRRL